MQLSEAQSATLQTYTFSGAQRAGIRMSYRVVNEKGGNVRRNFDFVRGRGGAVLARWGLLTWLWIQYEGDFRPTNAIVDDRMRTNEIGCIQMGV